MAPQTYHADGPPYSSGSQGEPNGSQSAFSRPPRPDRSPGVSDPFFGTRSIFPARSTLARTHTMPSAFQHQDRPFTQPMTARVPQDDFYTRSTQETQNSRPSTGPPSTMQYGTPFAYPSILSRPQSGESRPATASGDLVTTISTPIETAFSNPVPRQITTQHRLPDGMTAIADDSIAHPHSFLAPREQTAMVPTTLPMKFTVDDSTTQPHPFLSPQKHNSLVPSNLPVNPTPYLPPIRPLPFPKRGSFSTTVTKSTLGKAENPTAHSSPMLRPIRPALARRESAIPASSPIRLETGSHSDAERPQTPLPMPVITLNVIPRNITTPAGSKSSSRHMGNSVTSKYQTPLSTLRSTDTFDGYPTSSTISSPIRPQLNKSTRVDSPLDAPACSVPSVIDTSIEFMARNPGILLDVADNQETLSNSNTSGATSEVSQPAALKRKAEIPAIESTSPPKKKAAPRKRAPKATAPTPAVDPDAELMKIFKDYDVSSVMQDFTSQRPGSGRQNFVNELICRHMEDATFADYCENVENAWCRIGLEHPGSEIERRRAAR